MFYIVFARATGVIIHIAPDIMRAAVSHRELIIYALCVPDDINCVCCALTATPDGMAAHGTARCDLKPHISEVRLGRGSRPIKTVQPDRNDEKKN